MKTIIALAFVSLSSLAVLAGCTANTDTGTTDSSSADLTSKSKIVGSYKSVGTNSLPFYSYEFKSDHTFTAVGGCNQDGDGPHCFAITGATGKWSTKKSDGSAQLVLVDSFDQTDTYFYDLTNNSIVLNTTLDGQASYFLKEGASSKLKSGDICQDNDGNSLGDCPDNFGCESDGSDGDPQQCLPQE